MSGDRFDLEKVNCYFKNSIKDEDDVIMDDYLEGYKEIYKFFHLLGTVFGFVSSDVRTKVEILEEFRKKENCESFESFKIMMEFEKSEGLLVKTEYVSGSRTLLRLHRGLDFIREFLDQVAKLQPHEKTSNACQNAYHKTLAQHHPWLVRKAALVAMYALPSQEQLLKKVCVDAEKAIIVLPDVLEIIQTVYDRTEKLYTKFDLHHLP